LEEILETAIRAPSWANTQPWEFAIATGKPLDEIRASFLEKQSTSPSMDVPRPPEFPERYAARIRVLDKQNRLVTQKDWENAIDVNINGVFLCCRAVLPQMMKQREGNIINIS
jgi:NAD(P)-dependent dehydrogenase (short-subunit alcohol dehydrogenase family)